MQTKEMNKTNFTFFSAIALIAIVAILVGFLKTFIIPIMSGTKTWPVAIYGHAVLVFSWVLLFLIQSVLIQNKRYKTHISIGKWAAFVAFGAAFSIIPAALYQCERELKDGLGQTAISTIVGAIASAIMFLSLVALAIVYRKKSQVHKRLMLLATIILIWPAWFRWRHYFPSVERPDIWFGVVLSDSLIIVAFIWDWLKNKRIHPALFYGGFFIIAENCMEVLFFDSRGWRIMANAVYDFLK